MNQSKTVIQRLQKCCETAPLPVIAILLYLALRSSSILNGGLHEFNGAYHPGYFGWYDLVLAYAIVFSFITGGLKLEPQDILLIVVGFFIVCASWTNTYEADRMFVFAGLLCFFRFISVFIFAKSLVRELDYSTAESVLLVGYAILVASAVWWYSLQFGVQNRMAASAMTSASFGQVSAVMCLIFYVRKHYLALFFSFIFLFLSFSRTSLLLFLVLIVVQNRQLVPLNLIKYLIVFVLLGLIGILVLQQFGGSETQVVLESRFSTEEISNLNGRSLIWSQAADMIKSYSISITGAGFHMTPSLIDNSNLKFLQRSAGVYYMPPHYHNIVIEYVLGLGILSLIVFFYLVKRIWQTFQLNCSPAFLIYAFFFLSQILDYTVFAPKEIVIFGLMLGLAEGQLRCQVVDSCKLRTQGRALKTKNAA